jgi:hypothetical protein
MTERDENEVFVPWLTFGIIRVVGSRNKAIRGGGEEQQGFEGETCRDFLAFSQFNSSQCKILAVSLISDPTR